MPSQNDDLLADLQGPIRHLDHHAPIHDDDRVDGQRLVGKIGAEGLGAGAVPPQLVHGIGGIGNGAAVVQRHVPAVRGEVERNRAADATGTAGDENHGTRGHGS